MPKRISSLANRLASNGAKLHRAREERAEALGADHAASEAEQALTEERRLLKEERAKRQERGKQPGPKAIDKLVRTHHPLAKEKPKATKEAKAPHDEAKTGKPAKAGKAGPTRAEKSAAKASALDAARRAGKKSAKT